MALYATVPPFQGPGLPIDHLSIVIPQVSWLRPGIIPLPSPNEVIPLWFE